MFARAYLWLCVIAFLGLGIALMVWPAEILAKVDLKFETPTAFADIRADYGGCILGVGMFLGWCAISTDRIRIGLLCSGWIFAGYATGRLFSLIVDGIPRSIIFMILGIEILGAALSFILLRTAPKNQTCPR